MNKKRLKNYGLWLSVASLLALILGKSGIIIEDFNIIVESILHILVLLGIINNPTKPDSKGFNL